MPNVTKDKPQFAVFVCDDIKVCFDNKPAAVAEAIARHKEGGHAPWNYTVYKIQKVWTADK